MTDHLVLCYHAVSERWPAALSVTPERFAEQIAALQRRGYRGVTFSDVALGKAPDKSVAITFDDAFSSTYELGRPILAEAGMPATVFVPTAFPGSTDPMAWPGIDHWRGGEHERELACMSWDQLAELSDAGWEIGSHTVSHPFLTQLSDEQLTAELESSKAECERRLGSCISLAYPYGDYDERVVGLTRAAGYLTACTLPKTMHAETALAWPRVGVYHDDTAVRFQLKTRSLVQRLRANERIASLGRRVTKLRGPRS